MNKKTTTTIITTNKKPTNGKTKKTTKRTVKTKRPKRMVDILSNDMDTRVSIMDLQLDVDKELTTLFGDAGGCRGIQQGYNQTALCRIKNTFNFAVPAGQTLVYGITPANAQGAATGASFFINPASAILNSTSVNPWTSVVTTGTPATTLSVAQPGVFNAVNPAASYRARKCRIIIEEVDSNLNAGGKIEACHVPNMSNGVMVIGGANYVGPATYQAFQQQPFYRLMDARRPVIYHWFPSEDEVDLQATTEQANANNIEIGYSGLLVLITAPVGNGISYTINLEYILEYVPTDAYRPFVWQDAPLLQPNIHSYVTKHVNRHWQECILAYYDDWLQYSLRLNKVTHAEMPTSGISRARIKDSLAIATSTRYRSLSGY